ncbi:MULTISPECIES: acyl-CoA dehydrogenase family protein [unclassified Mycobacterium]|uniref:acyl-CoA dehydrogenase family protein n=1 Tax=unclassified Mycobacterium TaxID=2642494 RepID=UPI0029C85A0E|nr:MULTISPECIES: acyl-CoA dehydrogenase family protein [unclassified Mycobacterium]
MDFSLVELSAEDAEFQSQARSFLARHLTPEVSKRASAAGDGFAEELHLAMGAEGWLERESKGAKDGGFTPVQRRIWDLERRRAGAPMVTWGGTMMILQAVRTHGSPELLNDLLPRVYRGEARFAMGYTEPEGGSDVATCKTRAERDGDDWIINGQKMFTSGAHNCQHIFLLTNTDPTGGRHRNLTMFLVPVDTPGIEIQGLRTIDGERSNITFYSDVRIADVFRIGEVNDGWRVLSGPLASEHGANEPASHGLADITTMSNYATIMATVADRTAAVVAQADSAGTRPVDDDSVALRLGRAYARIEVAQSTPGLFGRVAIAQTMRDTTPDLMDLLGSVGALPASATGAINGDAEHLYRWAPLVGIYGGTIDVFRNMIAQYVLGLGKPNYSPPKATPKT